jgi:hypothetical protein
MTGFRPRTPRLGMGHAATPARGRATQIDFRPADCLLFNVCSRTAEIEPLKKDTCS